VRVDNAFQVLHQVIEDRIRARDMLLVFEDVFGKLT
jgi:hypothetical protein